ncbi:RNA 2',3'-cyclic phosphodiesterase [Candidatus Dojkabacteria bacterium]|nr:RNA 2',3'-cyclic phosphodiesterase [Candidatus Dojkabacteria bacterium]
MERKFKKKRKSGLRLFLGFKVSQEIRNLARDVKRELKVQEYKLRFSDLEQLHLTVKFLGNNVSSQSFERLEEVLPAVFRQYSPFKLKVSGVQFGFSKQSKPKILYLKIDDTSEVLEIKAKVNEEIKKLAFRDVITRADRKTFTSHITIARVEKDISKSYVKEVGEILENFETPPLEFEISEAHIIKSVLEKNGPRYSTIATFPFRGR